MSRVPGEKSEDNRICLFTDPPDPQPSRKDCLIEEYQGSVECHCVTLSLESQIYIDMLDICLENKVLKSSLIYCFFEISALPDISTTIQNSTNTSVPCRESHYGKVVMLQHTATAVSCKYLRARY